jgi:hypothetical protein
MTSPTARYEHPLTLDWRLQIPNPACLDGPLSGSSRCGSAHPAFALTPKPANLQPNMFSGYLVWLVLAVLIFAFVLGLLGWLRPIAKEARRRARSHGPVVSKRRGPSIHLAAKVKGKKR